MPICEGARLKIKRADKHIAELESCIDRLGYFRFEAAHIQIIPQTTNKGRTPFRIINLQMDSPP